MNPTRSSAEAPVQFEWANLCVELTGSIEPTGNPGSVLLWFQENFSTHPVQGLLLGDFSISAKRALLLLPLSNATMPLGNRSSVATLLATHEVSYSHKTTASKSNEQAGSNKISGAIGEKGVTLGTEGQQVKKGVSESTESSISGTDIVATVAAGGVADQPTWLYEIKGANRILVGSFGRRLLGQIEIQGLPFSVRFQVKLRSRDVEFTGLSGLLPETIAGDPNKYSIAKAMLWRWLKPRVEPYLLDRTVEVKT